VTGGTARLGTGALAGGAFALPDVASALGQVQKSNAWEAARQAIEGAISSGNAQARWDALSPERKAAYRRRGFLATPFRQCRTAQSGAAAPGRESGEGVCR